jgi:predicted metalloprotease
VGVPGQTGEVHILRVVVVMVVAMGAVACNSAVSGSPVPGGTVTKADPGGKPGVDPSFVKNTDGGDIDRLAAAVVTDVLSYWKQTFPATFGKAWTDLSGGFFSVDTADEGAETPPCARRAIDVEGNAFYCPTDDVVAWDRSALLPVLRDRFGEAAVMLVLAHEMGHAVQRRAGLTLAEQRAHPDKYPTILIEAQADCYAGTFVRWVADGKAAHLQVAKERLDSALRSLITFRDPIGTQQSDRGAHGDAFDRVSAFQDGYDSGAKLCAGMSVDNRKFTLRGFLNATDAQNGGNIQFNQVISSITPSLNTYFSTLVSQHGKQFQPPTVRPTDAKPDCTRTDQGPVAFCPDSNEIDIDSKSELPQIHTDIGDYATGTLLAARYGLAALAAIGRPTSGTEAQFGSVCLTGSFTGFLLAQTQQYLSPGDLDEAVQVLLDYDYATRDVTGHGIPSGFERVRSFRRGVTEGDKACGLT